MSSNRYSDEVQSAINRLNAGGRLILIEEKPYPAPHQVVIILGNERFFISYNDFAFLMFHEMIQLIGSTVLDGFPAEEYILSPDFHE